MLRIRNVLFLCFVEILCAQNFPVCDDFMVVMAGKLPWLQEEQLTDSFYRLSDRIRLLSHQMLIMNSTLTIFISNKIEVNRSFIYPRIHFHEFNPKDLLISYGFKDALSTMNSWKVKSYTRTSDILRILLAHKYKKTYIDTDIHFLDMYKKTFMGPFTGAAMWSDSKCGIEISNSAFCLPSIVLEDMIGFIKRRILQGSAHYEYTELGPSMFHKILMNKYAITLYSQNHPADSNIDRIVQNIRKYNHTHLHLTGHVRKGNPSLSYIELVQAIRRKANIPNLSVSAFPKPIKDPESPFSTATLKEVSILDH